jgi:biotin carboxylase
MKQIVVIGAGENQKTLIEKAKSMFGRVIVYDTRQSTLDSLEGVEKVKVESMNLQEIIPSLQKRRFQAVCSDQSDFTNRVVGEIANYFGLVSNSMRVIDISTNKILLREFVSKFRKNLNPKYFSINPSEKVDIAKFLQFASNKSVIIKPAQGQGSRGVTILNSYTELVHYLNNANTVEHIVEEYIEGIEYSVDAFVTEASVQVCALARKVPYRENACLDELLFFNFLDSIEVESMLRKTHIEFVRELGVRVGFTHAEYKIGNDGKIYLIDFATRGGGSGISSHVSPFLTGIDLQKLLLQQMSGEKHINIDIDVLEKPAAIMRFLPFSFESNPDLTRILSSLSSIVYSSVRKDGQEESKPGQPKTSRPGVYVVGAHTRTHTVMRFLENEGRILESG